MDERQSNKFFTQLLVGLFVTIIGGIIVAWYIGEGERFQSNPIPIRLTSNHCYSQDFYVDDERVISSIAPNSSLVFKTSKGDHWVYSCSPTTNICGDAVLITWTGSTSYSIKRDSQCPLTIILINENCAAEDYYIDGNLVAAAIAPNSTVSVQVAPGKHEAFICSPGTNNCGDKVVIDWITDSTQHIARHPQCPITIILNNESCYAQDYYVDGKLVVSALALNSNSNFEVTPGTHETFVCLAGTNNCSDKISYNWTVSTVYRLTSDSPCG